jgi:hypothetical protein
MNDKVAEVAEGRGGRGAGEQKSRGSRGSRGETTNNEQPTTFLFKICLRYALEQIK